MQDEVVIKVDGVDKDFTLVHEKKGTVKGVFTSMFRKATIKKETQHALKDISFEIKKGEFFGIVGRNGSGKSTLLKILAGIYQPTKGTVSTNGKLVPFIELGVGFNPELSGKDNVYLNGAVLGFSAEEVDAMYDQIVEFAELERFMDQKLKNYSSGMQVRLAFSMAIRANAEILLVDEVLAVGDADFQRKCFNHFKKLKKDRKTVVFVSHDMESIKEYCDRVMLIDRSVVKIIGKPNAVAEQYQKLFSGDGTQDDDSGVNSERWGTGAAETIDVKVIVQPSHISVIQEVRALSSVEKPVLGFRIRDASGSDVTGTNNRLENKPLPDMQEGDTLTVEWKLKNIFSDGQYMVDLAIQESNGITVIDWWDEAANFKVKKMRHIPYSIDPGFSINIV